MSEIIPQNYKGCQNCKKQPEPITRCDIKFNHVVPVCPYWELNKKEIENDTKTN